MVELKATIKAEDGDHLLDELIALFEAHGKDCTCGIVGAVIIGYVEEDMLSKVTTLILRYADQVNVQMVEAEALVTA